MQIQDAIDAIRSKFPALECEFGLVEGGVDTLCIRSSALIPWSRLLPPARPPSNRLSLPNGVELAVLFSQSYREIYENLSTQASIDPSDIEAHIRVMRENADFLGHDLNGMYEDYIKMSLLRFTDATDEYLTQFFDLIVKNHSRLHAVNLFFNTIVKLHETYLGDLQQADGNIDELDNSPYEVMKKALACCLGQLDQYSLLQKKHFADLCEMTADIATVFHQKLIKTLANVDRALLSDIDSQLLWALKARDGLDMTDNNMAVAKLHLKRYTVLELMPAVKVASKVVPDSISKTIQLYLSMHKAKDPELEKDLQETPSNAENLILCMRRFLSATQVGHQKKRHATLFKEYNLDSDGFYDFVTFLAKYANVNSLVLELLPDLVLYETTQTVAHLNGLLSVLVEPKLEHFVYQNRTLNWHHAATKKYAQITLLQMVLLGMHVKLLEILLQYLSKKNLLDKLLGIDAIESKSTGGQLPPVSFSNFLMQHIKSSYHKSLECLALLFKYVEEAVPKAGFLETIVSEIVPSIWLGTLGYFAKYDSWDLIQHFIGLPTFPNLDGAGFSRDMPDPVYLAYQAKQKSVFKGLLRVIKHFPVTKPDEAPRVYQQALVEEQWDWVVSMLPYLSYHQIAARGQALLCCKIVEVLETAFKRMYFSAGENWSTLQKHNNASFVAAGMALHLNKVEDLELLLPQCYISKSPKKISPILAQAIHLRYEVDSPSTTDEMYPLKYMYAKDTGEILDHNVEVPWHKKLLDEVAKFDVPMFIVGPKNRHVHLTVSDEIQSIAVPEYVSRQYTYWGVNQVVSSHFSIPGDQFREALLARLKGYLPGVLSLPPHSLFFTTTYAEFGGDEARLKSFSKECRDTLFKQSPEYAQYVYHKALAACVDVIIEKKAQMNLYCAHYSDQSDFQTIERLQDQFAQLRQLPYKSYAYESVEDIRTKLDIELTALQPGLMESKAKAEAVARAEKAAAVKAQEAMERAEKEKRAAAQVEKRREEKERKQQAEAARLRKQKEQDEALAARARESDRKRSKQLTIKGRVDALDERVKALFAGFSVTPGEEGQYCLLERQLGLKLLSVRDWLKLGLRPITDAIAAFRRSSRVRVQFAEHSAVLTGYESALASWLALSKEKAVSDQLSASFSQLTDPAYKAICKKRITQLDARFKKHKKGIATNAPLSFTQHTTDLKGQLQDLKQDMASQLLREHEAREAAVKAEADERQADLAQTAEPEAVSDAAVVPVTQDHHPVEVVELGLVGASPEDQVRYFSHPGCGLFVAQAPGSPAGSDRSSASETPSDEAYVSGMSLGSTISTGTAVQSDYQVGTGLWVRLPTGDLQQCDLAELGNTPVELGWALESNNSW